MQTINLGYGTPGPGDSIISVGQAAIISLNLHVIRWELVWGCRTRKPTSPDQRGKSGYWKILRGL